jgi:CRISPR-associated protein Cas2
MFIVVAYDVANDRRRVRLRSVLRKYGLPVQESVWECHVTAREARALKAEVRKTIRKQSDLVRFYTLCADCQELVEDERGPVDVEIPDALVV